MLIIWNMTATTNCSVRGKYICPSLLDHCLSVNILKHNSGIQQGNRFRLSVWNKKIDQKITKFCNTQLYFQHTDLRPRTAEIYCESLEVLSTALIIRNYSYGPVSNHNSFPLQTIWNNIFNRFLLVPLRFYYRNKFCDRFPTSEQCVYNKEFF